MLQKAKEFVLSKFREPDFKNQTGILQAESQYLDQLILFIGQAPPQAWKKRTAALDHDVNTTQYDVSIDTFAQDYRGPSWPYLLRVEEIRLRDQPTELFRHPDRVHYVLRLLKQDKEVGSVRGKRIEQLYHSLEEKQIDDLSFAPFKKVVEGLPSAPQKGDYVSLSEALNRLLQKPKNNSQ